jgi:uncharacterized protein (DUF362 family)
LTFLSFTMFTLAFDAIEDHIEFAKAREPSVRADGATVVSPSTKVGIVQSEKGDATELGYEDILAMVELAVLRAGGLGTVVEDGDTVAIKPNLVTPYDDSNNQQLLPIEVNGITTDWRVTRAVVELVRRVNPNGTVVVMEGSAGVGTQWNMNRLRYTHASIPGVDEFVCLEDSGGWHEWDSPLLTKITLPEGAALYPDYKKPNRSPEIFLNKRYFEADVLISVPVLKNHYCTGITGAIKNIGIGATPANIYGSAPDTIWRGNGIDHSGDMDYLHKWIHDFYLCRPIDFVVVDGLQGLSNGPTCYQKASYEPHRQNMRLVLAGRDAVAVDSISSLIVGIDPFRVGHLVQLDADQAGENHPALIRVAGHPVHAVRKLLDVLAPGADARYFDVEAPALVIGSAQIIGDELRLSLSVSSDTVLVEVALDGRRVEKAVVDAFDTITLDVGAIEGVAQEITVYAYDRFLNRAEATVVAQGGE